MNAAETCRQNGWDVGTRLTGDEGWGPTNVVITAVGHTQVLTRPVQEDGLGPESTWIRDVRNWKETT